MGCASSKPEPDPCINNSRHGTPLPRDPSVKHAEPQVPDFAASTHYQVVHMLGEGGSGQTWLCRDVHTHQDLAIKFIQRPIPKVVLPMILHEVKIQAALGEGHVNLVQARALLLTRSHLGLAMEYVDGGNLTAYVMSKFDSTGLRNGLYMTEPEAQYFFKQFLSAVEYLHLHRVAHRDLKLDNIVMDRSNPPRIKLCDFGFAKNWEAEGDGNMFTQIGTPVYMSPQVISSKNSKSGYDAQKADVWACGVLLFVMLLGMFPYEHAEHPDPNSSDAHVEVWLQQVKGSWRENPRVAESAMKLSDNCRDLLDKIFEMNETKRIDIPAIRAHPWYCSPLPAVYEEALRQLAIDQARINTDMAAGVYQSDVRDQALQRLVNMAGAQHTQAAAAASHDAPAAQVAVVPLGRSVVDADFTLGGTAANLGTLEEEEDAGGADGTGSGRAGKGGSMARVPSLAAIVAAAAAEPKAAAPTTTAANGAKPSQFDQALAAAMESR